MKRYGWAGVFLILLLICGRTQAMGPDGRSVRNIIVMIGDGMGFNQVYATALYDKGTTGTQAFDQFPFRYAMTTYALDGSYPLSTVWASFSAVMANPTDSAPAATAMSTGEKTYDGAIGMIGHSADGAYPGKHAIQYCEERGMATGVVSTVMFSHATPAGFTAHYVSRNNYSEIAREMLTTSTVDVIMGTGHPHYNDNNQSTPYPDYNYVGGQATWDALKAGTLAVADADHNGKADDAWTFIETKAQFEALPAASSPPRRVCGVPQVRSTLQQARRDARGSGAVYNEDPPGVVPFNAGVPTLATMARGALNVLGRNPKGFFLMVEGGAIDWAGHASQQGRIIEEGQDFFRAVEAVIAWVEANSNWHDTVLIVTADHETGHLWGPNSNPAFDPVAGRGKGILTGMKFNATYHTNALVPFYAKGPAGLGEVLAEQAFRSDQRRGYYLDNTSIGRIAIGLVTGALQLAGEQAGAADSEWMCYR